VRDVSSCQLYLISPPEIEVVAFCDRLKAAFDGGAVGGVSITFEGCH